MVDELQRAITTASGLAGLCVGLFAFLKSRRQLHGLVFLLISVTMSLWAIGEAMTVASLTLEDKIFWTRFQGIGELLLVPSYLLLALVFPRVRDFMRDRRKALAVLAALYLPWIFNLVALYTTDLIYTSYYLTDYGQGVNVTRTSYFWFLTALGFAEIIASIVIFLRERGRSESVRGRRGLLILALAPVPMLVANAIQNLELNRIISTPQSSIIFVSMLAYGILRYGLFVDMHSVTKHILVNAAVLLFDIALFLALCIFFVYPLGLGLHPVTYVLMALSAVPFLVSYRRQLSWATRAAERWLYGRDLAQGELLRELGRSIRTVGCLEELAQGVAERVRLSMELHLCAVMIREDGVYRIVGSSVDPAHALSSFAGRDLNGSTVFVGEHGYSIEGEGGELTGYLRRRERFCREGFYMDRVDIGVLRSLRRDRVQEMVWREEEEGEFVSVPLEAGGEDAGLLWIGGRSGGASFKLEELDLISTLSTQLAVSLLNSRLLQELMDKSSRLQRLIHNTSVAQEVERIRIARELHDGLASFFLDAVFRLETLEQLAKGSPDLVSQVRALKRMAREGMSDLRRMIADLRPSSLEVLGLERTLRTYLERFVAENRLELDFEIRGDMGGLGPLEEVTLFRVAQEALSNIARHAGAGRVAFFLDGRDGRVEMRIEDDGVGFAEREVRERMALGDCLGMRGMEERAELMQGSVTFESRPGGGTRVIFSMPVSSLSERGLQASG
ncbi:MAG: hypothetical protein H5T74_11875 [Actinobacteria bacterium]|nr:hypothetical protein [Actinomycetota bacterium]